MTLVRLPVVQASELQVTESELRISSARESEPQQVRKMMRHLAQLAVCDENFMIMTMIDLLFADCACSGLQRGHGYHWSVPLRIVLYSSCPHLTVSSCKWWRFIDQANSASGQSTFLRVRQRTTLHARTC
eukprot:SAG31_NODE_3289_length_4458_cov_2.567791_7_plen_130_part_00